MPQKTGWLGQKPWPAEARAGLGTCENSEGGGPKVTKNGLSGGPSRPRIKVI